MVFFLKTKLDIYSAVARLFWHLSTVSPHVLFGPYDYYVFYLLKFGFLSDSSTQYSLTVTGVLVWFCVGSVTYNPVNALRSHQTVCKQITLSLAAPGC